MAESKVSCSQCGLDYFPQLIKFHNGSAFCELCEMDYIIVETQKKHEIILPSYFLSNRHLHAFLYNIDKLPESLYRSSKDILSAYIHSIPALQQHPTIDMPVFDIFPFIWQFDLIILDHSRLPGTDIKIKRDDNGKFKQTKFVKRLGKDLQVILYVAHLLTTKKIEPFLQLSNMTYNEVDTSQLSAGFSLLLDEIVRFYENTNK